VGVVDEKPTIAEGILSHKNVWLGDSVTWAFLGIGYRVFAVEKTIHITHLRKPASIALGALLQFSTNGKRMRFAQAHRLQLSGRLAAGSPQGCSVLELPANMADSNTMLGPTVCKVLYLRQRIRRHSYKYVVQGKPLVFCKVMTKLCSHQIRALLASCRAV
jgi:hypothetical protein